MNTMTRTIALGAAAAAASMLAACAHRVTEREVVREQPIIQQAPAAPAEHVTIVQPPPAPRETPTAPPSATGYSWVPGHYQWRDDHWTWISGVWVAGTIQPMPPTPAQESPTTAPASTSRWIPGY
jgi:hypothetical protein